MSVIIITTSKDMCGSRARGAPLSGGQRYVYWSPEVFGDLTAFTVATTATFPGACAGATTVHAVVEVQLRSAALVDPNTKLVAVLPIAKPVPLTLTPLPPAGEPMARSSLVTVGVNLKRSTDEGTVVATGVVTLTSTTPAASGGETAVIELADVTLKLAALLEPNPTAVAPVKLLPVMVTVRAAGHGSFPALQVREDWGL